MMVVTPYFIKREKDVFGRTDAATTEWAARHTAKNEESRSIVAVAENFFLLINLCTKICVQNVEIENAFTKWKQSYYSWLRKVVHDQETPECYNGEWNFQQHCRLFVEKMISSPSFITAVEVKEMFSIAEKHMPLADNIWEALPRDLKVWTE